MLKLLYRFQQYSPIMTNYAVIFEVVSKKEDKEFIDGFLVVIIILFVFTCFGSSIDMRAGLPIYPHNSVRFFCSCDRVRIMCLHVGVRIICFHNSVRIIRSIVRFRIIRFIVRFRIIRFYDRVRIIISPDCILSCIHQY